MGPEDQKQRPSPEDIALGMVTNLVELNAKLSGASSSVLSGLGEMLDTLNAHFDVVHMAMDIAADLKSQGKKIGIGEFAECWKQAADEILPEEEGEDPDDQGDVLAGRR